MSLFNNGFMMGLSNMVKQEPQGEDPINPQLMKDWNSYVDWLDQKGMKGHKDLDNGETSFKYLEQYIKENPATSLTRQAIKPIQEEMSGLAQSIRELAGRKNDPNAENIMRGTSVSDGIPGSKTTSFKFPDLTLNQEHNGNLVSSKNLGLIDKNFNPVFSQPKTQLPKGAKLEKLQDGWYYEDANSGDLVKYKDL